MTLCDAGPMVALIDRDDPYHEVCVETARSLPPTPLVTTWPALTEAMHLLGRETGPAGQNDLWALVDKGLLEITIPAAGEWVRVRDLMRKYADAPMDLADASLVAAAERLGVKRVFTLDRHFRAYRFRDTDPFDVIP